MLNQSIKPVPYWSVQDEMKWQDLLEENPFLERLHLRNSEYGPPRPAPWGNPKSTYPVPKGEKQ